MTRHRYLPIITRPGFVPAAACRQTSSPRNPKISRGETIRLLLRVFNRAGGLVLINHCYYAEIGVVSSLYDIALRVQSAGT